MVVSDDPRMPAVVKYLDTASAYDLWSEIYDTDNNFLQALDSLEMRSLLPKVLSTTELPPKPWRIVDLGCGTGRNTVHLLDVSEAEIIALDLSPKMLDVARKRLSDAAGQALPSPNGRPAGSVKFQVYDVLNHHPRGPSSESLEPSLPKDAHIIISTLVIEHVPLPAYFSAASAMLRKGGLLLLTNMHSDMGRISQAGFVHPKTGEKIRPQSYAHSIEDVVREAGKQGLEVAVGV
jgi:SAM-dependent methyltransferase